MTAEVHTEGMKTYPAPHGADVRNIEGWVPVTRPTCIVVAGVDAATLWDCECRECRRLQRQAALDDE